MASRNRSGSTYRSGVSVITTPTGEVECVTGVLKKKRQKLLSGGWKTRYCELRGTELTWTETLGGHVLGSCDVTDAVVDGEALRAGGSDMDSQEKHLIFTIKPTKETGGKVMELKAPSVSDARQWIQLLSKAAKGQLSPTPTECTQPTRTQRVATVTPEVREILTGAGLDDLILKINDMGIETLIDLSDAGRITDSALQEAGFASPQIQAFRNLIEEHSNTSTDTPETPVAVDEQEPTIDLNEWASTTTGDGQTYYYNIRTSETTWTRPQGFQD